MTAVHAGRGSGAPTVSVVMPVYNVARYVATAIESVLAQTLADFELLLVDDGGNDGSMAICRGFTDPRIRILSQANRGLAGARNTGISAARGRYIALLDADDLWLPHKLELHVRHLEANPAVGVSYCPSEFIDDDGRSLNYFQAPLLERIDAATVFLRNPVGNGSAPVIRREVFEQIAFVDGRGDRPWTQYFDQDFRQSEDIECWVRIALTTRWLFAGIPEPLTRYRLNAGGLSADVERQLASWERMVAKTAGYAPDFIDRWAALARAYQLRYLARRSIRSRHGALALSLLARAVRSSPRVLSDDWSRSVGTTAAALALCLLPSRAYAGLERSLMDRAGRRQCPAGQAGGATAA